MNTALSFFADENISTDLINWVKTNGYIISGVKEENMVGASDISIIQKCFPSDKIILTHDSDFGKIIFTTSVSFFSIKHKELIGRGTLIIGHRTGQKIKVRNLCIRSAA